jgi:hypothetical protein
MAAAEAVRCGRACGGIGRQHDSVLGARREGEGLVHVGNGNGGGRRGEAKGRVWWLGEQSNEAESEREKRTGTSPPLGAEQRIRL